MNAGRLRRRNDRFELRGWTYWVSLADHGKLAALVADTDDVQHVKLMTELTVEVRPGDVPLIFEQLGWPIPGKRRTVETPAPPEAAAPPENGASEGKQLAGLEYLSPPEVFSIEREEPQPDPRDEELAALRAQLDETNAALSAALSKPPVEVERVVERVVEVAAPAPVVEAEPEGEPGANFADLFEADETIDEARARLTARLVFLRHLLLSPQLRAEPLTSEERAELQDIERRQAMGRWLDA